jgi:hypothetical protein
VVSPLLQALRAYTGYYITLLAGRAVDGEFDMLSVNAGTTQSLEPEGGLDFADWDPAGYSAVLDRLIRFIVAAGMFDATR